MCSSFIIRLSTNIFLLERMGIQLGMYCHGLRELEESSDHGKHVDVGTIDCRFYEDDFGPLVNPAQPLNSRKNWQSFVVK